MGCNSSKVGQKPLEPSDVPKLTLIDSHPLGKDAEESRPAAPTTSPLKTLVPKPSKLKRSDDLRLPKRLEEEAEGETIVDESGLIMRTPRRGSARSLHVAAKSGDLSLVQDLLHLSLSASSGPGTAAEGTLTKGIVQGHRTAPNTPAAVDIDERGMWGNTPLLVATQYAHEDVALAFVENGADVCAANERGATALLYACSEGCVNVGRALIERGAKVDPPVAVVHHPGVDGGRAVKMTPLISAAIGGHNELVRSLVESGAMVDRRVNLSSDTEGGVHDAEGFSCEDGAGTSALMEAARHGHTKTCLLLVDSGARLLARDSNGQTALMHAIAAGHEETAKSLLDTARSVGVARRLAETAEETSGSDRGKRMGRSPLHLSCDKGLTGVVIALLAMAVRVDEADAMGATALLYASREGHFEAAQELLAEAANPSAEDNVGNTPLKAAEARADQPGGRELIELLKAAMVSKNNPAASIRTRGKQQGDVLTSRKRDAEVDSDACSVFIEDGGDEDVLLVDDWGKTDNSEDDNQLTWEPNSKIGSRQIHSCTASSGRPKSLPDRETKVEDNATVSEQVVDIAEEDILWVGDYIEEHELSRGAMKGDTRFAQEPAVEHLRPEVQVEREGKTVESARESIRDWRSDAEDEVVRDRPKPTAVTTGQMWSQNNQWQRELDRGLLARKVAEESVDDMVTEAAVRSGASSRQAQSPTRHGWRSS